MMNAEKMEDYLEKHPEYQSFLYARGFCITTEDIFLDGYPFWGRWNRYKLNSNFSVYSDARKPVHIFQELSKTFFIVGHAYDPFSGKVDETEILESLAAANDFWHEINNLTGVFCIGWVENDQIVFTNDAAGQQMVYYGIINNQCYVTSHARLVADHCGLRQDEYIVRLVNYRFYHFFGMVLPGDLSPYKELKRCQCNFSVCISKNNVALKRFWPIEKIKNSGNEEEYRANISEIADILHKTMALISEKWKKRKPAISVTGGMDSKTTLACANGIYDGFQYFSYISTPDEKVDADAAHTLCDKLGLEHRIYEIPEDDSSFDDFEMMREIFSFNSGSIGYNNRNDVRKRLYFIKQSDFDVEVKSWVDEIGRARYHKKYNKSNFPAKPTARYLTSFYKAFLHNRKLVKETDQVFEDYMNTYWADDVLDYIPWWDLFYWEFEWNAAEGLFLTSELDFAYETTIPYNNRRLLERMLSVPLQKRIDDRIQHDVISLMNEEIAHSGIQVKDASWTDNRQRLERLYLEINTRLPF